MALEPKTDALLNLTPDSTETEFDFQIGADGDILTEDQLDTAILVSLFTDRRAEPYQVQQAHLRRGWIGDLETPDDLWGSTLWLHDQSRMTADTASLVREAAQGGLDWMVRDDIASEVFSRAEAKITGLDLVVDIKKPTGKSESFLVSLWDKTGKNNGA